MVQPFRPSVRGKVSERTKRPGFRQAPVADPWRRPAEPAGFLAWGHVLRLREEPLGASRLRIFWKGRRQQETGHHCKLDVTFAQLAPDHSMAFHSFGSARLRCYPVNTQQCTAKRPTTHRDLRQCFGAAGGDYQGSFEMWIIPYRQVQTIFLFNL